MDPLLLGVLVGRLDLEHLAVLSRQSVLGHPAVRLVLADRLQSPERLRILLMFQKQGQKLKDRQRPSWLDCNVADRASMSPATHTTS